MMLKHIAGFGRSSSTLLKGARHFSTSSSVESTVLRYTSNGRASEVLKLEKEAVSTQPKGNQVFVKMLAAPINPADLNIIEGNYGIRSTLPAIAGLEGVGEVRAVGPDVKSGLKVGDKVIPSSPGFGTWRSHALTTDDKLQKIANDLDLESAATLSVNPSTAYRILNDFVPLKKGDVVIQNGANSMVGAAFIQLAHKKGIKTINVIRGDRPDYDEVVRRLKEYGADIVITDEILRSATFRELTSDLPKPKLALNCVGGKIATDTARALGDGGILVTYGGMSREPVQVPTSALIFRNIQLRGFWLTKWLEQHPASERKAMLDELAGYAIDGTLRSYVIRFRLSDYKYALEENGKP
eukprot:TRINITY_DN3679_c0_g1_i1.p1 TRINITY_DN3679_c0_g1~~TRINITY_DN3679_c0_g1_i1.p1  ORF type:complete len:354 (-),score=78.73 TRINITY_DN3679_c0_g1_i1:136-1197(-)